MIPTGLHSKRRNAASWLLYDLDCLRHRAGRRCLQDRPRRLLLRLQSLQVNVGVIVSIPLKLKYDLKYIYLLFDLLFQCGSQADGGQLILGKELQEEDRLQP